MNNERPFENIIPVQNIKVGYFEKEEYLRVIDRQEKQIESFAYQIMALQSRIETLEKRKGPPGEWIRTGSLGNGNAQYECSNCHYGDEHAEGQEVPYCWHCGAKMGKGEKNDDRQNIS